MSKISIDVEFLGGTDVETAIKEAKELATKLNVAYVCFDFNGVKMSIGQNADIKDAMEQFHSRSDYVIVS